MLGKSRIASSTIYDKVSAKTPNAIVDKEIWEMDKHDVAAYGQAGAVRGEKLGD